MTKIKVADILITPSGENELFKNYDLDKTEQTIDALYSDFNKVQPVIYKSHNKEHAIISEALGYNYLTECGLLKLIQDSCTVWCQWGDNLTSSCVLSVLRENQACYDAILENMETSLLYPKSAYFGSDASIQSYHEFNGIIISPDFYTKRYILDFNTDSDITKSTFRTLYLTALYSALKLDVPDSYVYFVNYNYMLKVKTS